MTIANITCDECDGTLEIVEDNLEIGETGTVKCNDRGWETEAERRPLSEVFKDDT